MAVPEFHFDGPDDAKLTFAFAHGAGVGMDSPFMDYFAAALAGRGVRVARFEFPYMVKRRADGRKRPPDRGPVLLETWMDAIEALGRDGLFVGGKSMGGRVASYAAREVETANAPVRGLMCLGFPFHAPGKPEKVRLEAVDSIATPTLILQGTRDPFGTADEVPGYPLSDACEVTWLEDGNHSFEPRKASGRTTEGNWDEAVQAMAQFMVRYN